MKLHRWDTKEVIFELECSSWEEVLAGALEAKVSFHKVDFREADISGGTFSGGIFYRADFRYATLKGANFSNAIFSGVDFKRADLTDVNFTNVILTDVNFSSAKGIDYFREYDLHNYKSFILVQTGKEPVIKIRRPQRNIPEGNTNEEFPDDESLARFECYQTIIRDYEEFKKQQGKPDEI